MCIRDRIEGDLIVPRSRGVEVGCRLTETRSERRLDRHVDVLLERKGRDARARIAFEREEGIPQGGGGCLLYTSRCV